MQKKQDPNPLNFFDIRIQSKPCVHFEYVNIPVRYNLQQSIIKWITENLKGRFYVGTTIALTNTDDLERVIRIGFEDAKECSYFTLACPHLKYN